VTDEKKPQCEWERCTEPAKHHAKWHRAAADGRNDAYDHANYCDGHMFMASANGATRVGDAK